MLFIFDLIYNAIYYIFRYLLQQSSCLQHRFYRRVLSSELSV